MSDLIGLYPDPSRWVLEIAFLSYVLTISLIVILERRRPASTLAWLLALIFIPVVGLAVYVLIGRRRIRRHRRRRARRSANPTDETRDVARLSEIPDGLGQPLSGLVRLAMRTAAAPLRRAENVEILHDGALAFERMHQAIEAARERIHAQFYIWRDDETGIRLRDHLAARAKAGVRVRVLYDDWGSLATSRDHFAPLLAAGGEVAAYGRLRLRLQFRRSRLQFRNHRKLLTVDGQVGFTGGLNVGNEYSGQRRATPAWNDLHVRIAGDPVVGLDAIFLEDWMTATGSELPDDVDLHQPHNDADHAVEGGQSPLVQIIPSGPDLPMVSAIAIQIAAAIATASKRCWVVTPYFVPTEALDQNLKIAALRGVDVRILLPAARVNDHRIVALAARSYYDEFLQAGCRIFEYQPGMLHAKYLVVDECVAAIGSANMDVRSFHINYEVTAMFYDREFTHRLAQVFTSDLAQGREVTPASRANSRLLARLAEASARVLSPLL
ncbi:MAG: cardiolipin synthase [Nannocystaceae bacterium]